MLHPWQPTPATHPLISIWPGISILGHIVGNSSNPIHKLLPTPHSILRLIAIKSLCELTKITWAVIPPSTGPFIILGKYSMSLSQVPHMWNGCHYHAYSLGLFWEKWVNIHKLLRIVPGTYTVKIKVKHYYYYPNITEFASNLLHISSQNPQIANFSMYLLMGCTLFFFFF